MQQDMDMAEIARGRRITAVTTTELNLTPRQSERPKKKAKDKLFKGAKKLASKLTK